MKKAILVGNGFSSQLIDNYNNTIMLNSFKERTPLIYEEIKSKYKLLHNLRINSSDENDFKTKVLNLIEKMHDKKQIETTYTYIMIDSGFYDELYESSIYGIESIIKVAELFNFENLDDIEKIATDICFNSELNGINGITATDKIDTNKAKAFFNTFDYVYTTNYDYLLDDLYDDEVKHIHGGFDYFKVFYTGSKSTEVNQYDSRNEKFNYDNYDNEKIDRVNKPFLIWGSSSKEKQSKMGGGFSFPITFPFTIQTSLVRKHLDNLKDEAINEIHLFGYSGLNDSHVNNAIKSNPNIEKVIYYCKPSLTENVDKHNEISQKFKPQQATLNLKSWDFIWNELK